MSTNTLRICNTYCLLMAKMVTRMILDVTFVHTLPVFRYIVLFYANLSATTDDSRQLYEEYASKINL